MLGYFVRRLVGGVLTLLLALLAIYSTLLYPSDWYSYIEVHRRGPSIAELTMDAFELEKPWPVSFLAYLFDPGETVDTVYISAYRSETYPKGIHVSILGEEIEGSGLTTGDFGRSFQIAKNDLVMDVYGPGLDVALAFMVSMIITFMYVATVQRIGRPTPYISRQSGTPAYTLRRSLDPSSFTLKG
ncbi:MAG: hypothetical protein M3441_06415 [Chloroflexota bacterium]|nr:hypothetical protein [Chloroflexota bacterium]